MKKIDFDKIMDVMTILAVIITGVCVWITISTLKAGGML